MATSIPEQETGAVKVTYQAGVREYREAYFDLGYAPSLSRWCRDSGVLLHCHRAMHAVVDRQKNHGIHWRVLAK